MLYMGLKIKFADIDVDTMNISVKSVKNLFQKKQRLLFAFIMADCLATWTNSENFKKE